LDGGEDGLNFFRQLASACLPRLTLEGRLMVEHGADQAESLEAIFRTAGWVIDAAEKDLSGRARIVIARRGEDGT
jgi:release factor glutamine methyltransferase